MAHRHQVSLEVERLRTQGLLDQTSRDAYIPMSLAAAMVFHELFGTSGATVYRNEYDDVLDITASALSRLLPVYTLNIDEKRVEVTVELVYYRFTNGATQLHAREGARVIEPLWVPRRRMLSAISFIRRAGIAYSFTPMPGASNEAEPAKGISVDLRHRH